MKTKIYDINGKPGKDIDLPKCFNAKIRKDIVAKVIETKKSEQPFGPSPVGGKQHSASGVIVRRRHVWKSGYGRGKSRVPRKSMSQKGSQFNWIAAEIPSVRGGRRAHPPKVISRINVSKINKKEMKIAICSALSATVDIKEVLKKYSSLDKIDKLPLVVESKLVSLKAKNLIESIKKILGKELFNVAIKKKSIRAGKGKSRGRKYKSNAGLLIVLGNDEKLKTNAFEVTDAQSLGVKELASGGVGRLTLYTEKAIKNLGEKIK